jgi:hypothetical protein
MEWPVPPQAPLPRLYCLESGSDLAPRAKRHRLSLQVIWHECGKLGWDIQTRRDDAGGINSEEGKGAIRLAVG